MQHQRILKNNIDHLNKGEQPPFFFYLDTNLVLGNVLVLPVEKIHFLVVTVGLTWLLFFHILLFNLAQKPNKSFRFRKFYRSNVHHSSVVQTNRCQCRITSFAWHALFKVAAFLFFAAVCPQRKWICISCFCWTHLLHKCS